ncbi:MAG: chloride channel protein [Candidatus Nanopelagicales bacterium]|nr:chloride channel protein [Candidatus Nanopelagicales bacterium]MCF8558245.1 chloride channel protein [Candidatus Nanopelagicales bacterium]
MTTAGTSAATRRPLPAMLVAGVIGLVLGYLALLLVNAGIGVIWDDIPASWESTPAWYVIGILLIAAVLVYVIRRFVGDAGHSPIGGITVSPLTPKDYVGAILAILASLWGGIVLGPEVALVATGSMVGTVTAKAMGFTDAASQKKIVGLGALGAILALLVGPILAGSVQLDSTPTAIELAQLGWAIPIAIVASVAVTLSRLVAALLARAAGSGPHLIILITAALIVAFSAILLQFWTGESVMFVLTSGEELISDLPSLTSVSTVIAILLLKSIAYAVSLGAGFRGGPFFPAMFVGAASGLLVALAIPEGPSISAAIVVGVVAATIATAPLKWPVVILLGVIIGFVMGTWTLVPAAVLGAVVARLIPRWGDRVAVPAHAG